MAEFRKIPVVIEAFQWFENGDHPEDYGRIKGEVIAEGEIVRYYRRPDIDPHMRCKQCDELMCSHGWIDTLESGHVVCPGDWIITGVEGEKYPCKPGIFEKTYEVV